MNRVQVKDIELTAKSVQGLTNIGIYTRLMITVINIDLNKVSGFPDIGLYIYIIILKKYTSHTIVMPIFAPPLKFVFMSLIW